MATIKVFLNTRYKSKENTFPIVIRIIDKEKIHYHSIGYRVKESEFKEGQVRKHPDALLINSVIDTKLSQAKTYISECSKRYQAINFDLLFQGKQSFSFIDYLKHRALQYKDKGQVIMKLKVDRFVKELTECFSELYFDDITQNELRILDAWLIKQGNAANTRHKKFKFLGMFFSQAIQEGKTIIQNPFKLYKIGTTPVKKEKLTHRDIKAIEDLQLKEGAVNDARNLFLFSYYTKGQRFETCLTLLKKDIKNDRIYFRSNKGKKYLSVLLHARLSQILNHYKTDNDLLFPYIKDIPNDPEKYRQKIGSLNVIVNRNLKVVAALCDIKIPLHFHIARHTFAFHLKQKTDNINAIQDSLGHSDQRTTEIYLQSLDDEALDSEMRKLYGD